MSASSMNRRHPHQPFDPSLISDGKDIFTVALLPAGESNADDKLILSDSETSISACTLNKKGQTFSA
jgi:hypothetical protein